MRWDEEDVKGELEKLFRERVRGKFIFFSRSSVEIEISKEMVSVEARASKRRMRMSTRQKATITEPEQYIRELRKVQNAWKQNTNAD